MLKRTHTCGELSAEHLDREVVLNGWVNAYRDFGGVVFIDLRDRYGLTQVVFEPEAGADLREEAQALRNEFVVGVRGDGPQASARQGEPEAADRGDRAPGRGAGGLQRHPDPAVRDRGGGQRGTPAELPLPRPPSGRDAADRRDPAPDGANDAPGDVGHGVLGDRDADPRPEHPGGGPRFPRPESDPPRPLLRPPPEPAALQAVADGRGDGPLLPDRPMLPRRGPPRQSPAGVHAARHRDVVRRIRGRPRGDGGPRQGAREGVHRPGSRHAPGPARPRRRDGSLRHRPARPPLRDGDRRSRRPRRPFRVQGLPRRRRARPASPGDPRPRGRREV